MKTRWIIACCIAALLCAAGAATAQKAFTILAVRGNVTIRHTGAAGPVSAAVGNILDMRDKLVLAQGSYVALTHTNGQGMELSKAGSHAVASLSKALTSRKKSGVTGRFADYVLAEMNSGNNNNADRRSRMSTTGATERIAGNKSNTDKLGQVIDTTTGSKNAVGGVTWGKLGQRAAEGLGNVLNKNEGPGSGDRVQTISPPETNVLDNPVRFVWRRMPGATAYVLRLKGSSGMILYQQTVSDTTAQPSVASLQLKPGQCFTWHVAAAGNDASESGGQCLYGLSFTDARRVRDTAHIIMVENGGPNSALGWIALGAFYEYNLLMTEALHAYGRAVEVQPGVERYRQIYSQFLTRYGR